jgi:hypothetical protein
VAGVLESVGEREANILRGGLMKWAHAGGFGGDPGSAPIAELLPRYSSLLGLLDSQYSSSKLTASTVNQYIGGLRTFLRPHMGEWGRCVDYPAMLSCMDVAWTRYRRLQGVAAAPGPLQAQGAGSNLTVGEVCSERTTSKLLQSTLRKWAQACTVNAVQKGTPAVSSSQTCCRTTTAC